MAVCFAKKFENHADRDVMLALCDHANDEGICWPSRAHIAWKMDRHPDTVKQSMKKFRQQGLIETRREANNDLSKSPVIRVLPHKLPDKEPREQDRGASDPPVGGASNPPGGGVSDPPKPSEEPPVTPVGDSQAPPDASAKVMRDPGGYYADLLKLAGKEPTDRERERCFPHLKKLISKHGATRVEMEKVIGKAFEARMGGFEWWPKDIFDRLRQTNVTPLRPVEPTRPKKRVIS